MSNFMHSDIQNGSSFNTLITLQKIIDAESSVPKNDKKTDQNYMSEDISCNKNSAEIIDHACYYSGINLVYESEWVDFTYNNCTNETKDISMNNDEYLP